VQLDLYTQIILSVLNVYQSANKSICFELFGNFIWANKQTDGQGYLNRRTARMRTGITVEQSK
jgi:hypothetical protein